MDLTSCYFFLNILNFLSSSKMTYGLSFWLHCVLLYSIVSYCILFYCIVLYNMAFHYITIMWNLHKGEVLYLTCYICGIYYELWYGADDLYFYNQEKSVNKPMMETGLVVPAHDIAETTPTPRDPSLYLACQNRFTDLPIWTNMPPGHIRRHQHVIVYDGSNRVRFLCSVSDQLSTI